VDKFKRLIVSTGSNLINLNQNVFKLKTVAKLVDKRTVKTLGMGAMKRIPYVYTPSADI